MIYDEIIQVIKRWKEETAKDIGECLKDGKVHAANYLEGKRVALDNVIDLLETSNKINKPWEEM